jgi:hypothetical protein
VVLFYYAARQQVSLGASEGTNNKLKVITRRAFSFRTYETFEVAPLSCGPGELSQPPTGSAVRVLLLRGETSQSQIARASTSPSMHAPSPALEVSEADARVAIEEVDEIPESVIVGGR